MLDLVDVSDDGGDSLHLWRPGREPTVEAVGRQVGDVVADMGIVMDVHVLARVLKVCMYTISPSPARCILAEDGNPSASIVARLESSSARSSSTISVSSSATVGSALDMVTPRAEVQLVAGGCLAGLGGLVAADRNAVLLLGRLKHRSSGSPPSR
ncbi:MULTISPECIES: hypothetical protein [Streptomyces violaceusniger group]|uniref:hypothetical protein n=1 Tax=Streptomyces violaceusniger group TaxID=2839105 RepID=UPI0011809506|nr:MULTISPECIES: hypothetical protein [Streptomyces violaceusniger group]